MKLHVIIFSIAFVLFINPICAETKKIVQDNDGKVIETIINEQGIIQSISGTVSSYYPDDEINITSKNNKVIIHKSMSGDGCYDIEILNQGNYLTLTKIFISNKEVGPRNPITYNIYFEANDNYLIKDDFVKILKDKLITEISDTHSESYLPMIKYQKNTCIQYFGKTMPKDGIGSRKYVYSDDFKTVECFQIRPGDVWQKYMTATIFDFKSSNKAVNLINYIILYNYDYQLGAMLFPILINMDDVTPEYQEIEITADSYLTEGTVKYLPENLKNTALSTPWVEGKKGDGIGTIINVKAKSNFKTIIISNGFDSEKKSLYINNNRVKGIRIIDSNNKKNSMIVELPDSPNPYSIDLSFITNNIKIEILSVYNGEKYDDTCLNYILVK